jgi:multisubunit Na+/H+ antiporter MnhE subunit
VKGLLLRAAGLLAVYLLVLTSLAPGDLLIGGVLALVVAHALRPARKGAAAAPPLERFRAAVGMVRETAVEMARGSWRVARFCLGAPASPGVVEIPRAGRSRVNVAIWGVLTGEAPDEVVVDVDDERDLLIVHLVDAEDSEAVRERHRTAHERSQRKVVA